MHLQVLNINEIGPARWQRWQDLLSEEEADRAGRYRQAVDRKSFVAGRGVVRELAAAAAGVPESAISIKTTARGKPFVEGMQEIFQFSISHSAEYLAILWHQGPESVGVDIEKLRADFDYDAVVHHYFSEKERQQIQSAADFFKLWTRKEALLKALGTGLVDELKGVEVHERIVQGSDPVMEFMTLLSEKVVLSCAIPQGLPHPQSSFHPEKFNLVP